MLCGDEGTRPNRACLLWPSATQKSSRPMPESQAVGFLYRLINLKLSAVCFLWMCFAGTKGLEPSTFCVTGRRSNQLSYAPVFENLGIYEFKNLGLNLNFSVHKFLNA